MIIILKPEVNKAQINELKESIITNNAKVCETTNGISTILGIVGDTSCMDIDKINSNPIVDCVKLVKEPYKKANRQFHPKDSVINVGDISIGGGSFNVIAGPCSIESKEQITQVATDISASGATLLRGGAFKPRTSPYAFQGLHDEGLQLLLEAKKATHLPIVTEIMSPKHLELFENVDVIQVGARNMQNFELLKELSKIKTPILLKRGLANTLEELLMSAEYIMAGGNENVILCERGIRTFEPSMRNTLDISAVPMLKSKTHLPVIIDPSHAAGLRFMVEPLSMAAIAVGADGLMIEVHNNPEKALCDGPQSLTPEMFDNLMGKIRKTATFFGKEI